MRAPPKRLAGAPSRPPIVAGTGVLGLAELAELELAELELAKLELAKLERFADLASERWSPGSPERPTLAARMEASAIPARPLSGLVLLGLSLLVAGAAGAGSSVR